MISTVSTISTVSIIALTTPPVSPVPSSIHFRLPPTISPSGNATSGEERPFHCPEPGCYQQFKRKFTLAEHMKTHTGERPFVCPVQSCGKSFATSGNLARHKRLHPWLKPQKCLVNGCDRSFSNEAKLERHLKTHFKGPREILPCKVKGCDKSFSTMGNLTRHMKHQRGNCAPRNHSLCHSDDEPECEHDIELTRLFATQAEPSSKAFKPLVAGDAPPVTDEELLEFLDDLFEVSVKATAAEMC